MPHDIRIVHSQEFLRTDAQGHYDFEATRRFFMDILWACHRSQIGRILVDVRDATTEMTTAQVCKLAGSCREVDPKAGDKIAILNPNNFERSALASQAAQAEGWNVAAFRDFEDAFEWLADPGNGNAA
jgi:hypothetical protein